MDKKFLFYSTLSIFVSSVVLFFILYKLLFFKREVKTYNSLNNNNNITAVKNEEMKKAEQLVYEELKNYNTTKTVIENLKVKKEYVNIKGEDVLITRSFTKNNIEHVLAVDTQTLRTFILRADEVKDTKKPLTVLEETRLMKLITSQPIKNLRPEVEGYSLTVDLCEKPKKKSSSFEIELFRQLQEVFKQKNEKLYLAVAITKRWATVEKDNFFKIINMKADGEVDITWINHSAYHPVNGNKFLTSKNVALESEVLDTEQMLLENGEVPSVFFRFPGLKYNDKLLDALQSFYLIPVDANAWLSKGEHINKGSIVLIHGNGNEHGGVKKFLNFLKVNQDVKIVDMKDNI